MEILSAIQTKIDNKTLVISDLENIYTAYTTTNDTLKNTDAGLLPKSSGTLSLSKIDMAEVLGEGLTFDYVRVDAQLPVSSETYPKLTEIYAMNAPELRLSASKIAKTHTVKPTATDAKSVQGLYPTQMQQRIYGLKTMPYHLRLKVKASEGVFRYYKILLQHPPI